MGYMVSFHQDTRLKSLMNIINTKEIGLIDMDIPLLKIKKGSECFGI